MRFHAIEVPVAISMMSLADRVDHAFQRFFCYWAAFNNIYTLVAERVGLRTSFELDRHGRVKTEQRWTYTFPKVRVPREHEQISQAIQHLDPNTKQILASHPSVHFFVERQPQGVHNKHDTLGQEINGVLNVNRTVNPNSPIWSPINRQEYEKCVGGDFSGQEILTEQIVFMLYAIRNNLLHGSKSPGEENDMRVVENALPLLELLLCLTYGDELGRLLRPSLRSHPRRTALYALGVDPKEVHGEDFPGETFRVLKEKEVKQFGEYRTRRLVLEAWDRLVG
jgi:hypothetical protein